MEIYMVEDLIGGDNTYYSKEEDAYQSFLEFWNQDNYDTLDRIIHDKNEKAVKIRNIISFFKQAEEEMVQFIEKDYIFEYGGIEKIQVEE